MKYFVVLYWYYFNLAKFNLFVYLKKNDVEYSFAYKKVYNMNNNECTKYLAKELSISKAYRIGYSDGDYWNGSQNPYDDKSNIREWLDYEKGFESCKKDKQKNIENFLIREALNNHELRKL